MEVDGTEIWRSEAPGTRIALPAGVRGQMTAGRSFLWTITARNENGQHSCGEQFTKLSHLSDFAIAIRIKTKNTKTLCVDSTCGDFLRFASLRPCVPARSAQVLPTTIRVSSETAPPGGMAQMKVLLTSPMPISSGGMYHGHVLGGLRLDRRHRTFQRCRRCERRRGGRRRQSEHAVYFAERNLRRHGSIIRS